MIFIDTKRLHLRNVSQNDVDEMFDYRNNEICARYQYYNFLRIYVFL